MKNLKELRIRKGYTQKSLGAILGVTDRCVSAWESGRNEPNYEMAYRLSLILECNITDIMDVPKPRFHDSLSYFEEQLLKAYHDSDELTKKMVNKLLNLEEYTWQE